MIQITLFCFRWRESRGGVSHPVRLCHTQVLKAIKVMVARGEPPSVDLEYDVATAYREAGQLDEAVEAARRALELQPQQADGRVLLKAAYSEAGRHAEAHAVSAAARPSTQPEAPPPSAGRGTLRQGSVEVFMEVGLQDAGLQ